MPVYKNEKAGTWFCKFYFVDWTGTRKQKKKEGFKTKKEAQEFERDYLGKCKTDCAILFGALVENYMADCKARLKPTTYANKQFLIDSKVLPYFKDMPLNAITPATIRKWQNILLSDPHGYSPTYLKTVNNQVSAIFNFACRYYKLAENPVRLCGSMGKKNADSMQFWTVDEFTRFIATLDDRPAAKVIFELLFWTGIRSGEMLALTLNDFNFNANTVNINKNYARQKGQDLIMTPKTPKSKRVITMPPFLSKLVQNYAATLYGFEATDRLFQHTKSYLLHEMIRGCEVSGVKRIRIHDLRHSHASFLIEQGFSPLLISERLGHENIETTLGTYSHLYPNKHGEVADRIEQMISTDSSKQLPEAPTDTQN